MRALSILLAPTLLGLTACEEPAISESAIFLREVSGEDLAKCQSASENTNFAPLVALDDPPNLFDPVSGTLCLYDEAGEVLAAFQQNPRSSATHVLRFKRVGFPVNEKSASFSRLPAEREG